MRYLNLTFANFRAASVSRPSKYTRAAPSRAEAIASSEISSGLSAGPGVCMQVLVPPAYHSDDE